MRSVGSKVLVIIGAFAVVFLGLGVWRAWVTLQQRAEALTASKAELGLQFDLAIRRYAGETIRPLMEQYAGKDEFLPQAMSSSYVARSVFEDVRKTLPDYIIKFSSDNPRNPANAAGPEELRILRYFRDHPEADKWAGRLRIASEDYFVQSIPRRMDAGCLHCHGRPEDAPASLVARYGPEAGFHRSPGDVVALDMVGIPVSKTDAAIASDSTTQLATLGLGVAMLAGIFVLVFRRLVSAPLAGIAAHFQKAADQPEGTAIAPIEVASRDEIGTLASSFNALAARLGSLHSSLEQRVEERTALLQAEVYERQRVEETLQMTQFCIDHAADAVFWVDSQARVVYVNQRACSLLGYSGDELRSLTVHDFDPSFSKEAWPRHWEELRQKKSVVIETSHRTKRGDLIPVEISVNHFEFDGKEYNCAFARDIGGRKRAEEELARAKQAAEAANRAKSEFLANMSHEIRTPMTAIMGYLDILAEGCSTTCPLSHSGIGDPLSVIRQNADHLLCVIDDVLDLSKIEAGKVALERGRCSPSSILADAASLMRVRAAAKGLSLEVVFEGRIPDTIECDPTRLRQILLNLLGNAIKFTEAGGVRMVTKFRELEPGRPMLQIQVVDSGIGMSPEAVAKLFQPFTQADASTTRRFGGTGLGLTISKRLAQLLGGDISAVSEPGKGSTFTLTLPPGPMQGVTLLDVPSECERAIHQETTAKPNATPSLPAGCRLLLAEDGPDNQRLIAFLLRKAGAEVVVAGNGQEAVDLAVAANQEGEPFHAILMDMQMPVMDGYQASQRLRKTGYQAPIIALTAHAMAGDRQKCLDAGCNDYIAKPIERTALLEKVARNIQGQPHFEPDPPSPAAAC